MFKNLYAGVESFVVGILRGKRENDGRRTVEAKTFAALANRFRGLGSPGIFHEVAALL